MVWVLQNRLLTHNIYTLIYLKLRLMKIKQWILIIQLKATLACVIPDSSHILLITCRIPHYLTTNLLASPLFLSYIGYDHLRQTSWNYGKDFFINIPYFFCNAYFMHGLCNWGFLCRWVYNEMLVQRIQAFSCTQEFYLSLITIYI